MWPLYWVEISNARDARDPGSILGLGRSPGGEHDNPLQYSCLENPMDRGAWWATVHGVTKVSDTTHWLNNNFPCQHPISYPSVYLCDTWCPLSLHIFMKVHIVRAMVFPVVMYRCTSWTIKKAESESEVAQSCPTLCDPVDCSLPGSSVHGIFQARILEWVAISFSRGSSRPRDRTLVSSSLSGSSSFSPAGMASFACLLQTLLFLHGVFFPRREPPSPTL